MSRLDNVGMSLANGVVQRIAGIGVFGHGGYEFKDALHGDHRRDATSLHTAHAVAYDDDSADGRIAKAIIVLVLRTASDPRFGNAFQREFGFYQLHLVNKLYYNCKKQHQSERYGQRRTHDPQGFGGVRFAAPRPG